MAGERDEQLGQGARLIRAAGAHDMVDVSRNPHHPNEGN
jgi:hypothetical protein